MEVDAMAFRRFKFPRYKPVKVGEEYDVEISEIGSKGDGIARVKNFVVFVRNSKKGEKTRIKIKKVYGRFAIGEKIKAEKAREYVEGVEEITEEAVEEAKRETESEDERE